MRSLVFGVALLLITVTGATDAMAQVAEAGVNLAAPDQASQGLLDTILNAAAKWDAVLREYATNVFWSLAVIQFVYTMGPLSIRGTDFGELVGELVRFILVIGFFAALLMYSAEWATAIIDSFRQAGASAAGLASTGLRPGDMFGTAVELAFTIGAAETLNPMSAIGIIVSAIIVLICFAFIAAFMFVTLVESYIVINASVLFMGFGASQWTREYSVALLRYTMSVGAKLFVLTLIVGIILESAKVWQQAYNHDDASMLTMVGLALVSAYLSKTIPEMIQGLISGVSSGNGSSLGSIAAIAAMGATTAVGAMLTGGAAAAGGAAGGALGGAAGGAMGSAAGGGMGGLNMLAQGLQSGLSGAGSMLGGGGSAPLAAQSAGQRTGGYTPPPMAAPATGTGTGTGTGNGSGTGTGGQQSGSGRQAPAAKKASRGHKIAESMVRGSGIMAAMTVPGMEGAAGLSLGPPPPPNETDSADPDKESESEPSEENVIEPITADTGDSRLKGEAAPPTEQSISTPPKGGTP